MKIAEIIKEIEKVAPRAWQESWDNSGLQVGSALQECTGVLIAVDATPGAVDEAVSLGCNLIVTHHPLFFKGVKRLTGATPVEVTAMNAIAAGVSI
jgi:putative NIF3 family GTP cyclohydrolase 1 type 2